MDIVGTIKCERYHDLESRLPSSGSHIIAQSDARSIVVYQAFSPEIARYACRNGHFGGPFSLERMSWIKPGFLWMMYRSGWGTKPRQEATLAIRMKREGFDRILSCAVPTTCPGSCQDDRLAWEERSASATVRVQWDPDHDPGGARLQRRAIQLGLRGDTLRQYAREWIFEIIDLSEFVEKQRVNANGNWAELVIPTADVYRPLLSES